MIGSRLGRYRILARIPGGHMGVVYRARDDTLRRDVVVKTLPAGALADERARRAFRREALALSRLNDARIETVHDFGTQDGVDYLVVELIQGEPLSRRIARGPLSVPEVIALGAGIAEALAVVHAEGIVHRDIKPSNVMVLAGHGVKLIDFGLARLGPRGRVSGSMPSGSVPGLSGTWAYMAPECFRDEPCRTAADVYALGAVLFEMATGRPPFEGDSFESLAYRILNEPAPSPEALRPDLPPDLAGLVREALDKAAARRPPGAATVAARLRALQPDRAPSPAPVPGPWPPWLRRLALTFAALAVAVLVGVILRPACPGRVGPPTRVAVAVFENRTGDPALESRGRVAADWIALGLAQTGLLEVVPPVAVLQAGDVARAAGPAWFEPAELLALETGAGTVVWGAYHTQGDSLIWNTRISDARRRRVILPLEPVSEPRSGSAEALDRLRRAVTGALAAHVHPELGPWVDVSMPPPSLAAYREFVDGMRAFARRDWRGALGRFRAAAALEPGYATAGLHAALCHLNLGQPARVDSIVRALATRQGDLPPLDRRALEWLRTWLAGDLEGGLRAARAAAEAAPATLWHYQVGLQCILSGRPLEAQRSLRALDPERVPLRDWAPYWETLTAADHMLGDHRRELADARRGRRLHPQALSALGNEVRALAALGDTTAVRRRLDACEVLTGEPGWSPGSLMLLAGRELRAHGRPAAGEACYRRAAAWFAARAAGVAAAEADSAGLAAALYGAGHWEEAARLLDRLAAAHPANLHYAGYLGALAARRGDRDAARAASGRLPDLGGAWARGADEYWQADIAALLGDRAGAIALLRRALDHGHAVAFKAHADPDLESLRGDSAFGPLLRSPE